MFYRQISDIILDMCNEAQRFTNKRATVQCDQGRRYTWDRGNTGSIEERGGGVIKLRDCFGVN